MSDGRLVMTRKNRPHRRHRSLLHRPSAASVNLDFDCDRLRHPSCHRDVDPSSSASAPSPPSPRATPPSRRASSDAGTAAGTRPEDVAETTEAEAEEEAPCCGRPGTADTRLRVPPEYLSDAEQLGPRTAGEDGT